MIDVECEDWSFTTRASRARNCRRVWGKEEEEEEDAYKVEVLAVPVLMLSEFERPNMVVEARRFAPWNTGLDIATVSLLLFVCCCGEEINCEIVQYLRLLRLRPATIGEAGYCSQ